MFELDPKLREDTEHLASWPLCEVLLMNDSQYPWLILVPRKEAASELYHLDEDERRQLDVESVFLSETLMSSFSGEKLNVAALGNVVKQLHIHHIVRYSNDPSWPAPIWGKYPPKPYTEDQRQDRLSILAPVINKSW